MGYKARFVARGFSRKEGLDYEETFATSKSLNTYMMSLTNIVTFATRLIKDDKLTDGCEKNTFEDKGSWYPVTLDGYIEY